MDKQLLIERCKAGDRAAFGKLYTHYAPRMMRVIRRFIADRSTAEDILHDGFVVVFTHIAEVKETAKIEQWMGTIMRNLALQYLQQIDITTELDEEGTFEDCPEPEALLTYEELQTIIERLPEGYKTIFRLSVLEGKSHKEIAALLGIAPHSASSQLYHARVLLRKLIAEHLATIAVILLLLIPVGTLLLLDTRDEVRDTSLEARETSLEARETRDEIQDTRDERQGTRDEVQDTKDEVRDTRHKVVVLQPTISANDSASVDASKQNIGDTIIDTPTDTITTTGKQTELPEPLMAYAPARKRKARWAVSAGFSTSATSDDPAMNDMPQSSGQPSSDPTTGNPPDIGTGTIIPPEETAHHDAPLTFGLHIGRPLTPHWSIETGIDFTYLHSQFGYHGGGVNLDQETKAYYLGIPVKLSYHFYSSPKWSVYGTAGVGIEIPVKSSLQRDDRSTRPHEYGATSFHAPWQGTVSGGIGVEYKLTPHLSLYAEPSVQYHFGATPTLPTVWQDRPTVFTIPVGIRLNW